MGHGKGGKFGSIRIRIKKIWQIFPLILNQKSVCIRLFRFDQRSIAFELLAFQLLTYLPLGDRLDRQRYQGQKG